MQDNELRVLSVQGVRRLPYYLKFLKEMQAKGTAFVPAISIADSLGIYEVQVRKDLLDEKGALHLEKAGLIAYSHGLYHQLGKVTGFFGWSVARPEVLEKRMKEYR